MRKFLIYTLLLAFASSSIFASCEEQEKRAEARKKHRLYFTKYEVYDKIDSSYTGLSIYVGEFNKKKITYHIYDGKNKSNMEVWCQEKENKK